MSNKERVYNLIDQAAECVEAGSYLEAVTVLAMAIQMLIQVYGLEIAGLFKTGEE